MSSHEPSKVVPTSLPCCLTGSRLGVVVGTTDRHGQPLRTVVSVESGLVFTDPRPCEEEIRHFYAEDYRKQYKRADVPKMKHVLRAGRLAQRRLARLGDRLARGSRVFDAGAGGGEFVHACRAAGHHVQGVEPNKGYAQYAIQNYGVEVHNGFYQDIDFEPGSFDCVTLFHVLEHLENPVAALRSLAERLRPGGTLVVEVPNVESIDTAPSQRWHLGHLYNFGPATLTATGMKAGLKPLSVEAGGVLFALFEKPATSSDAPTEQEITDTLEGVFESTHRLLVNHTPLRHYLRAHVPLKRVLDKWGRAINETRTIRAYQHAGPARMLDDLAAKRLA